jgi:hypothetical protein
MSVSVSAPASQPVALFAIYIQYIRNRQLQKRFYRHSLNQEHIILKQQDIIVYSVLNTKNREYVRQQVHLTPVDSSLNLRDHFSTNID